MKKKTWMILCACVVSFQAAMAQRITRQYDNVPFASVLKDMNAQQSRYTINFVYDELEDFRVTKHIQGLSVPDAIRQLIGFYPIKMTQLGDVIVVECTQKAPTKMTGHVIDSHHQPVEFANVALLSPTDSTLITGGVTNEDGLFVIPCEARRAIVRVSCVGYRTMYHAYPTGNIGTIALQGATNNLKTVVVKAMRQSIKMGQEGMVVDIQNSDLNKIGTATDVLRELPRVNVSSDGAVSVFAKGSPLIYINNRAIRSTQELQQLKSDNIKNVEIITSPGARYGATTQSVIRIKTIRRQDEGWSGQSYTTASYNRWWAASEYLSSAYRQGKTEVFGELGGHTRPASEDAHLTNTIDGSKQIFIKQTAPVVYRSKGATAKVGIDFSANDDSNLGMTYEYQYGSGRGTIPGGLQQIWENTHLVGSLYNAGDISDYSTPIHNFNAYYIGKVGKLSVDFNATYYWKRSGRIMHMCEQGTDLESRDVHTQSSQHGRMSAAKLVLSYPLWSGTLSAGSELSSSNTLGRYNNDEQYVDASNTEIRERNIAGFAEYALNLGSLSVCAGVRYEHITSRYYTYGQWQEQPSRRYADWFPSASLSWSKGKWSWQLGYTRKTHRPSYNSLRDEIQYDNRYTYEGGNPYLRSSVVDNVDLNVVHGWLSLNAGYRYTDKPMIWTASLYQGQDIIFLRNLNFTHSQGVYASLVATPRLGCYHPMFEVDYSQTFLGRGPVDITPQPAQANFSFRANNRLNIGQHTRLFVNLSYSPLQRDELLCIRPTGSLDVRLTRSLLSDQLVVGLFANDLLKTSKERWALYGSHTQLTKDAYGYSRCVGITLSYNYHPRRSKYRGTGAGNAEKNRL